MKREQTPAINKIILALVLGILSYTASSQEQVYQTKAGIRIPLHCRTTYLEGLKTFKEMVQHSYNANDFFRRKEAKMTESCREFFNFALMDSQFTYIQTTLAEYVLELNSSDRLAIPAGYDADKYRHNFRSNINSMFGKRLELVNMSPDLLKRFYYGNEGYKNSLKAVLKEFSEQARKRKQLISVGRFAFTYATIMPHTYYEYKLTSDGHIVIDKNKNEAIQLVEGSLIRAQRKNFEEFVQLMEEYLNWNPNTYFGQDSLIYDIFSDNWINDGVTWVSNEAAGLINKKYKRYINWNSNGVRLSKEDAFGDLATMYLNRAMALGTDLHHKYRGKGDIGYYYFVLKDAFFEKQAASIQKLIVDARNLTYSVISLPAIYFSWKLTVASLMGLTEVVGSAGTAMGIANNLSMSYKFAAASATVLMLEPLAIGVGFTAYDLFDQIKQGNENISVGVAAQALVDAAFVSLPYAVILPPLTVWGLSSTGQFLTVSAVELYGLVASGFSNIRNLQAAQAAPLLKKLLTHNWARTAYSSYINMYKTAWQKEKWFMVLNMAANFTSGVAFTYVSREHFTEDPSQRFFVEDKNGKRVINDNAKYDILWTAIATPALIPTLSIESPIARTLVYRASAFSISVIADFGYSRVVEFDVLYGFANTPINEGERDLLIASEKFKKPGVRGAAEYFLFSNFVKLGISGLHSLIIRRPQLMDMYDNESFSANAVRDLYFKNLRVDLTGVPDKTLERVFNDEIRDYKRRAQSGELNVYTFDFSAKKTAVQKPTRDPFKPQVVPSSAAPSSVAKPTNKPATKPIGPKRTIRDPFDSSRSKAS